MGKLLSLPTTKDPIQGRLEYLCEYFESLYDLESEEQSMEYALAYRELYTMTDYILSRWVQLESE